MSEAGRPQDSAPLTADGVIGSLATRVRELSLRVAHLEGELEAARRRIAVYEDFDTQVQDQLSAALRAANQIRERARLSAEAMAAEVRTQPQPDPAELDAMRIERDTLRHVIEEASSTPSLRATAAPATVPMSEMRTAATEALRGVFKELVDEIRSSTPSPQPPVQPAAQMHAAAPARPVEPPAPAAPPPIDHAPPAEPPSSPAPEPAMEMTAAAPAPYVPPSWSVPAPAPEPRYVAPPSSYNPAEAQPMQRPTVVPPPQEPERADVVEDVDVAPAAAPAPPAAEPAREPEWMATPSDPVGEIQVVLSPISSFPRLVELERRLQGMPVVRTVYARDFRNSVATLAIGLRHPMTLDEFASAVTKLDYPRLRIVSTSGYVLELRIDSEASSIA
ncbi:MAG: hypothetical protein M3P16_02410 [Chloroflexota bacterium]|nr:hypothetical protein [Chloroflexota bacterium]